MSSSHWEEFYANHLPPADFEDNRSLLKEFCDRHNEDQNSIVLVTVRIKTYNSHTYPKKNKRRNKLNIISTVLISNS